MLKIRLQRIGRINDPAYRVVVVEHTSGPRAGKFVERVGTYNPKSKERVLDGERIKYWISKGAKASDTVYNMLISAGILTGVKKVNALPKKRPIKSASTEGAQTESPKAETTADAVSEEPSIENQEKTVEAESIK